MPNLHAIMAKKKRLQKQHPSWDNARALKEAWKGHKAKVSGTRKARPKKAKRHVTRVSELPALSGIRRRSASRSAGKRTASLGAIKVTAREQLRILETVYGELATRLMFARTVSEKKKISKKIQDVKKRISHIDKILHS